MRIATRLQHFDSSAFQIVFERKKTMQNPIDLSIGTPEELTPTIVKDAAIQAILDNHTTYTPANGLPSLRRALSAKLLKENHILLDENAITIVPGLTTGLLLVYMALLNPGDEVIIIEPYYPPYSSIAQSLGARPVCVPTLKNFQPDVAAIESAITKRTRMLVINSPNNPTGAMYSKDTLLKLALIAKKHSLVVVSDEIYEGYSYTKKHFSIGSIYEHTVTLNGFSKRYAMTGWRLGYIAGPQDIIDAINTLQQYVVFSSSSIAQHAALAALQHTPTTIPRYSAKRKLVLDTLKELGYKIYGADGAYYVYFQTPHGMKDSEFVDQAAAHNLLLIPGYAFSASSGFVRLSYSAPKAAISKGLEIIAQITKG